MSRPERPPLILVADDDETIRLMAREALGAAGFAIKEACDGLQTLSFFEQSRPDLLLLDVNMPELDGFRVCARIRETPDGEGTPILIMTGLEDLASINRAYEAGATDFITKPVNWVILRERVRYMIRAKKAVEAELEVEAKHRVLLEAIPDQMFQVTRQGDFLDHKPAHKAERSLLQGAELKGQGVFDVLPSRIAQQFLNSVGRTLDTGQPQVLEFPILQEGRLLEQEARTVVSGDDQVLAIVRDVTERKQQARALKKERDFVATVLNTATALVLVRDRQGRVVRFNRACEETSGYPLAEIRRKKTWEVLSIPEDVEREKAVFETLLSGHAQEYESCWVCREGQRRQIMWSNSVLLDEEGEVEYVISSGVDITDKKRAEEQIRFLAYYDGLTSLPNRVLFKEQLRQALAFSQRHHRKMAVMFLDIDRFKQINDTFGHSQGDQLLQSVADRLKKNLRISDAVSRLSNNELSASVGRFGGDEFTVLVTEVSSIQGAAKVAQRLLEGIAEPFRIGGREVFVTASMGISIYPYDGNDSDTLLKNADSAMYYSKDRSRNNYRFYSQSMNSSAFERLSMENDLHRALRGEEFELHFQPKVALQEGKIVGAEALLRWRHPEKGLISPPEFIQLAEDTGLIVPIGVWVIRAACEESLRWKELLGESVPVAVNLSTLQFRQLELLETVKDILKETGLEPQSLEFEITESTIMQNEDEAIRTLRELKDLGVQISIDDFGTGYSSLSYLKQFPVDALKIDRSFVSDIVDDPDDRAIVTAIIALAHKLDLRVVAEGVETPEQLEYLRIQACDEIQGFLFSPPLETDGIRKMLCDGDGWTAFVRQYFDSHSKGFFPIEEEGTGGAAGFSPR